jgi:hypothetical protein
MEAEMDNRINEIRKVIRALRVSMVEAETVMRTQIARDQDCSFVAQELLKMRNVLAGLVREKESLGDYEPIFVATQRPARTAAKPPFVLPGKRHPVAAQRAG